MDRFIAGLIAVVLGVALVRADGINIPAPSWTYAITSLGTGVATALGINVGSAGAFVTFNGAGGTPSSMTATNLSGTAASLTAGNVTTNANLTGEVTSVGNATTVASSGRLRSKLITITRDLTVASGSVGYTGVGFTPTVCFATGQVAASLTQYSTVFSMADSSRTSAAMVLGNSVLATSTSFVVFQDVSGVHFQAATIASYDADGFTLSWTKSSSPTGTATIYVLCYR